MSAQEIVPGAPAGEAAQGVMPWLAPRRPAIGLLSLAAAGALVLTACADAGADNDGGNSGDGEAAASGGLEIEDDYGTHTLPEDIESVGAFDNRSFRTLEEFGVDLSVAARSLMDAEVHGYAEDEEILDTGNHREPDFEQIVAAEPDLVINGQRYGQYHGDIEELLDDDAVILEFGEQDLSEDPSAFADGLIEKTEKLGEVFGAEDEAQRLVDDFQEEIDRVASGLSDDASHMGLMTSGGDLGYLAPGEGRTLGPLFELFDLEPALSQEVEDDAHADEISVEAIAEANPDWLLVTDRDARLESEGEEYQPAEELIEENPALQEVTAVQEGNIVYTSAEMYLTEDIQAYTQFLRDWAEALES